LSTVAPPMRRWAGCTDRLRPQVVPRKRSSAAVVRCDPVARANATGRTPAARSFSRAVAGDAPIPRFESRSGSRPNAVPGSPRWWPRATRCSRSIRCRQPVIGSGTQPREPRATQGAHVLAEIVRLDRSHHRPVAGDSDDAEAMKLVARSHQTMIWDRTRHILRLRSALREYFQAALDAFDDLDAPDALAVLAAAPDPDRAARLSAARISRRCARRTVVMCRSRR
jgi:hypothetical protein